MAEAAVTAPPVKLTFKPVTKATREDFVALFDRPGWQKQCWCMIWRATSEEGRGTPGSLRRRQMLGRIGEGVPVGLLGYDKGEPVAWVSIAPKQTYRRLGGPEPEPRQQVWSLACMLVRRDRRGEGLAHQLIAAAVKHAKAKGATVLEAYPVDPDSPSYGYMGHVPAFVAAGFTEVGREGTRRHVMQLTLKRGAGAKS